MKNINHKISTLLQIRNNLTDTLAFESLDNNSV